MTSLVLARQGAKVVSVSNAAENAETITAAIRDEGLDGLAHVADVTKSDQVAELLERVKAEYGGATFSSMPACTTRCPTASRR